MTREPIQPPRIFRRGDEPLWGSYECHECGRRDVPALVEFYGVVVAASDGNHDGFHLVCHDCLDKALHLFFDPTLIMTKTPMTPAEKEARDFATKMHGTQKYDSGEAPYVLHLAAVRDTIVEFGFGPGSDLYGESYVAAAWLHDVLEDTAATAEQVSALAGAVTLEFVWAVTGKGSSRKERNENAYLKMETEPFAIPLKLADRISNTRASKVSSPDKLFKMYQSEYPAFRARLYGPSLTCVPRTRAMWDELDAISMTTEPTEP